MVVEELPIAHTANFSCEDEGTELHSDEEHRLCPEVNKNDGYSSASPEDEAANGREMHNLDQRVDYSIKIETGDGMLKSLEDFASCNDDNVNDRSGGESTDLLKAPDGGYGWVICGGVFMNHMIFGGLERCQGLFFLEFQSRFGTTAQMTAWPVSLMSTLNLFMGPVCGAVVSRYSVRAAFMIGTMLSFTGMLLNGYAPNIYFLFLSHTLLGGIGRGLMSGILLLNLYFDKHRSLATGLGSSGVGIGSLWVVPLTQYLFSEYNFSGAFMILSGLSLHGFVMAMLFRPLRMYYRFTKSKLLQKKMKSDNKDEGIPLTADANGNLRKQGNDASDAENSDAENPPLHFNHAVTETDSDQLRRKLFTSQEKISKEKCDIYVSSRDSSKVVITAQPVDSLLPSRNVAENVPLKNAEGICPRPSEEDDNCCKSSLKICFPVEFKQQGNNKRKKAFHWNLLKHVPFMIFCFSNFLFILAFKTAFTFLPAIAMAKGLSRQEAALILTISGALDTFGRIATGFVMDFRLLRPLRPYFFNLLLFIIAGASLLIPSLTTFASFTIVCSAYGFLTGAFIAQKMVVLVDILGREMMPSSLGIQKVFQGFGTLIGPPFAGALRDALGSYDFSFYLGGACMIGAGLMLALSTLLLRIRNRKLNLSSR